jgi:hypothetical protein
VTLLPRGLLIEEQRANLATYSEQFDNAAWTEQNVGTISSGTFTAPDGTATAERMVATAGAGAHTVYTTTAVTAATGVNHAWTVYVKKDAYGFVYLCQNVSDNNNITAVFDLNGTGSTATQTNVGATSGTIASTSIQNVGNGWFRLSLVGAITGATRFCAVGFAAAATGNTVSIAGNVTFTAAGTEAVLIWGAQLEAGAFATSYIPTIASTVTRSADVATITGSLFSQWYRQEEGSFFAEATPIGLSSFSQIWIFAAGTGSSSANILGANHQNPATTIRGIGTDGTGVTQFSLTQAASAAATNKTAVAAKANDFAVCINGATPSTDASGTMPAPNRLSLGIDQSLASVGCLWLRSIRYVPVRAADFQLQQVTT